MNKYIFILTFAFFALITPDFLYAEQGGRGLIVSPERIVFEQGQRIQELILSNRGDQPSKYRISFINKRMTQWGNLETIDKKNADDLFADKYLQYAPKQVVLGPRETQKIRIMSRLPNKAEAGEYRSHLLIQEIPESAPAKSASDFSDSKLGVNITSIFGISLPVILRQGELNAEITLSSPKIERHEEGTFINFDINRTGNKSIFGTAKILTGGKEIGILRNVATYTSTPLRHLSVRIDPAYDHTLNGKEIEITFGAENKKHDTPSASLKFVP